MQAVLLDLDGVIYEGDNAIPGAAETVDWLQRREIPHLFLTNTSSRSRASLVEKLAGFGIHTEAEQLLTPPVVAQQCLQRQGIERIALFVPPSTRNDFTAFRQVDPAAEQGAEAVIVGDLGEAWDYATFNRAFRLLMAEPNPRLVALGMTRFWKAEDGLRLDVGPFVTGLSYATGAEPVITGKPAAPFFSAAVDRLGCPATEILMVGDDVRSDINGAAELGIGGRLVRTGKFQPDDERQLPAGAAMIDSIRDLPDLFD